MPAEPVWTLEVEGKGLEELGAVIDMDRHRRLRVLNASSNRIRSCAHVASLKDLRELHLGANRIDRLGACTQATSRDPPPSPARAGRGAGNIVASAVGAQIWSGAGSELSKLTKLETLRLDFNALSGVLRPGRRAPCSASARAPSLMSGQGSCPHR